MSDKKKKSKIGEFVNQKIVPSIMKFAKTGWKVFFNQAYTTTFGFTSIWAVVGIAYTYVKNEGLEDALPAGLTALSAFFFNCSKSSGNCNEVWSH